MDQVVRAEQLAEEIRTLLDQHWDATGVRKLIESADASCPDLWPALVEGGWPGLLVPQVDGGRGAGFEEAAPVFEALGRALVPGPLASSVVVASALLSAADERQRTQLLPGLLDGSVVHSAAFDDAWRVASSEAASVGAQPSSDGFVLTGTASFVPDAQLAHRVVVGARTDASAPLREGLTLFVVDTSSPQVTVSQHRMLDMTRRHATLSIDGLRADGSSVIGTVGGGWPVLERAAHAAAVVASAELVGVAAKALDISVEYAKVREQFGRPIGSFQAVKHKCADMLVGIELGRALVEEAARAFDTGAADAAVCASAAKSYCSEMATTVTAAAIQIHGGIGYIWDHDAHLYFRRAQSLAASHGTALAHRVRVAQSLG